MTDGNPTPLNGVDQHSTLYRNYVLGILTLVYAVNFIDRQILVILQESIKADMGLSDTQLGLLSGFAFAIFYVSVGIPIARWADVGNRKNIIALAITVWSGMTVLCGMAQNYVQLLLARIGVGVGEAGASPPAHSIISDYFPPERRGTAISIYSTGVYIGILFGFLLGGWINQTFGWRVAFFVVGLPGILVAAIVYKTIREPIRGISDGAAHKGTSSFRETMATLWSLRSFRYFSFGTGLIGFVNYGNGNFLPSFLVRIHDFTPIQVGNSLALIAGIGGAVGVLLGGYFSDKFGRRDLRWYLWVIAIPTVLTVPAYLGALFAETDHMSLLVLFVAYVFSSAYLGPVIALTHHLLAPPMRAMGSAILYFVLNLIGLGLGPLCVGAISDFLNPSYGVESIRYALAVSSFMALLAAGCFVMGAFRLPADLERMKHQRA